MMQSQFLLCAVPGDIWSLDISVPEQFSVLQSLIQDALGIERRLLKGVNLENERSRYILCCNEIESISAQFMAPFNSGPDLKSTLGDQLFPTLSIDETYLHFLIQVKVLEPSKEIVETIRLGSSFFPPDEVLPHAKKFWQLAQKIGWHDKDAIKIREKFFTLANETGCGVIEIQNPMVTIGNIEALPDEIVVQSRERTTWIPHTNIVDEIIKGSRRTKMFQQLRTQINRANQTNEVVNFSNQPHDITTEVLNKMVFSGNGSTQMDIRVVYADGSEGNTFPIQCLPIPSKENLQNLESLPALRIALISMRHLELDNIVDMAWFRNRDASQSRTLSEADLFCYEYSIKQLLDLKKIADENNGVHIHLYHTGFEPAVIAFYRAFTNYLIELRDEPSKILIVPYYYRGNNPYEPGCEWL